MLNNDENDNRALLYLFLYTISKEILVNCFNMRLHFVSSGTCKYGTSDFFCLLVNDLTVKKRQILTTLSRKVRFNFAD